MIYRFEGHSLDIDRRELRRGPEIVAIEPQVFDILRFLVSQRKRVVSKDDLLAEVWRGRIVSESTLASRVAALRRAVGDCGKQQRLIRTVSRKGFRFVGAVVEEATLDVEKEAEFAPPARQEAPGPSGGVRAAPLERRQLTIMACCVDGARAIASRLDPEDLGDLMTQCRGSFRRAVERNGGFVAKHTVDGLLAYFGYPKANEDDPENAVRAGLAAMNAVRGLRSQVVSEPLLARVGIATGLVVVGELNLDDAAPEHDVAGETLHLANRLLSAGMPGEVVISDKTRQLIGGLFDCRGLGTTRSPNEVEPIAAWCVVRESATLNRFEGLRSSRTRLIGREEELELLLLRWNQAKTGEGRVVLVWGEPGIGKSRLVAALQDRLIRERCSCLRFFCTPHRTQTALHPVVSHFEDAAGFSPGDTDETKLQKLGRLLASSRGTDEDLVLLADLLSIATGGRYAPLSISAQRRKELLLECFVARLAGLAAEEPLLLVLEDAHWIDPTTREWFDVVIDRMRTLPALLIMTYRPEFNPPWLGQAHVTGLTLSRLGPRENALLVKCVAGGWDLPPALLNQIVVQTDGVPLFIEEVTKSVLESGLLREADGEYVLTGPLAVPAVPWTLQASLNARLDRLASVRATVQTCAALGREFSYLLVKAVTALPDAELEPRLEQVVASGLVHQRGAVPHATYIFKHALVQDAAYEAMLKSQRSAIHARIVQVLEEQFPEILDRNPDVVAHHCRNAGHLEKAIDFSIKAARQALARSAAVEAQALVETAMSLLPGIASEPERRQLEGRLQVAMADTLVMTKGFASPEVMSCLSTARKLLNELDHPNETLRALCGQFNYHLMRSESPACLELAVAMLKPHHDRPTTNVIQYLVGTAHLHLGNFAESIDHLETALSLYDEDLCRTVGFVTGHHLRSFTLIWLGLGHLYAGSLRKATETMSAAVQDARSRAHPFTLVSALLAVARFRSHIHDLKGAIEATEEGFAIATEQRSPYHVSRANILRAMNMVGAGRVEEGIALMQRALAAHRATGANFLSSCNMSSLAQAHALAGDFKRAIQLADEAVAEVVRSGERWWEAEALRLRGVIHLGARPEDHKGAERRFESALACARRQGARLWELQATQSLAKLRIAKGRNHEAQELLAPFEWAFADGFDIVDPALAPVTRRAVRSAAKRADRSPRRGPQP